MSDNSAIEWCDTTWNPVIGCSKVSAGCANCYAMEQALRITRMGASSKYKDTVRQDSHGAAQWTGVVKPLAERLSQPLRWKRPRRVFVNSMSDLFHGDVPDEFIAAVFGVMALAPQHTFQVLTKRADRMKQWFEWAAMQTYGDVPHDRDPMEYADPTCAIVSALCNHHDWGVVDLPERLSDDHAESLSAALDDVTWPLPNVWLGVSAEDQKTADERIPHLLATPAAVRFVSAEPLLRPVDLSRWIECISHCGACGAENPRQREDRCPECGATSILVETWGFEEAERYRSGERWAGDGPQRWEDSCQISWVIVGGESGPKARPFDLAWARSIRDQCRDAGVSFFFKQTGSNPVRWRPRPRGKGNKLTDVSPDLRIRMQPGDTWPDHPTGALR